MFAKLIRAFLGAFGVIKKTKKFTTVNNDDFLKSLDACAIILTAPRHHEFIPGGIQGATDSFWSHAVLYVGKTAGQMLRSIYPRLQDNPAIGSESCLHETVEACVDGIIVSKLEKYLDEKTQMVAYSRPISAPELIKILYSAYIHIGKNYDFLEFISHILPCPNPPNDFVCASYAVNAWAPVERIVKPKIEIGKETPRDINDYLAQNLKWKQTRYNW